MKRYIREPGSNAVQDLLAGELVAISRLSEVEVTSALERRSREGNFDPMERDRALSALHQDLESLLVVEITPAIISYSTALLARHPLRTGDALQLASCVELKQRLQYPVTFWAFDTCLQVAARGEGLPLHQHPTDHNLPTDQSERQQKS